MCNRNLRGQLLYNSRQPIGFDPNSINFVYFKNIVDQVPARPVLPADAVLSVGHLLPLCGHPTLVGNVQILRNQDWLEGRHNKIVDTGGG